jgi:antitoxin VapB
MKTTTRTFKSGNSIAVRIPREFNVAAGKTFEIKRKGKDLILSQRDGTLAPLIEIFKSFPPDFFAEGRQDLPPQPRPELERLMNELPPDLPRPARKTARKAQVQS